MEQTNIIRQKAFISYIRGKGIKFLSHSLFNKAEVVYPIAMLNTLSIKNFAIIADNNISFKEGFTVLTGETGAGKSLIIDSLSLLLGERAQTEMIRLNEEKAIVKGSFSINEDDFIPFFEKYEIKPSDKLDIERVISKTKSVVKINEVALPLNALKELSPKLANIHDQFDCFKILDQENYLSLIDGFDEEKIEPIKKEYLSEYEDYKNKKEYLERLIEEKERFNENKDFFLYQYKELKDASLKENEDIEVRNELEGLKNFDKIHSYSLEVKKIMDGDSLDSLYSLLLLIKGLSSISPSYSSLHQDMEEAYYKLSDTCSLLKKELSSLDFDPERMDELNERDAYLSRLKRKYKKDLSELISYRNDLEEILEKDDGYEIKVKKANKEYEIAKDRCLIKAYELSSIRKEIAKEIETKLESSLSDLKLKARFSILFFNDDKTLSENGLDNVDFYIETNKGEGLKPLNKIVSGGEASRIMLAFKEIYVLSNKIPTVIFDEIDAGISGEAAEAVAKKIYEISSYSQVIAITHLPQVAAYSNNHILISKKEINGRTFSEIKELSKEEKIREIAKLISNGEVTESQLEYARELIR